MIGLEMLEMKMQSNTLKVSRSVSKSLSKLRSNDVISITTTLDPKENSYLLLRVDSKKKSIDVLPLDSYIAASGEPTLSPYLSFPLYLIKKIKTADKTVLLFLANSNNPHIVSAIESMK